MDNFTLIGIIGIVFLIITFFTNIPVAYLMAIVGFLGYWVLSGFGPACAMLSNIIYVNFTSYGLALVPLFIFMGFLAFYGGVSTRLYDMAYKWLGRIRGGMAMATVVACTCFGAVCGSTTATAATMGAISIPEMKKYKYSNKLSTGSVAAGGGLGILMPPSVVLIIYGILTQQSIGALFIAGIIPAIIISILFIIAIAIYCSIYPEEGPKGEEFSFKEKLKSLVEIWETLLVFILVMGGMFFGIFTPTRAGAIGSFLLLIITVFQKKLTWEKFKKAVIDTVKTSCMVILLVTGASIFGNFLALSRIPMNIATFVGNLSLPGWAIMGIICFIYLVAGCFIDALALITFTIPIFYPLVTNFGYDPIWFGVIIVLVTQMGIITPPVGINAYIVKGIAKDVPLTEVFIGCIPFLIALIIGTGIMIIFPKIVTFLPALIR